MRINVIHAAWGKVEIQGTRDPRILGTEILEVVSGISIHLRPDGTATWYMPQGRTPRHGRWQTIVAINGIDVPVWPHPEVGWVAEDNGGAQAPGCAYDHGQEPGPDLAAVFATVRPDTVPVLDAVLATDGWWWRVVRPYRYGLPD